MLAPQLPQKGVHGFADGSDVAEFETPHRLGRDDERDKPLDGLGVWPQVAVHEKINERSSGWERRLQLGRRQALLLP